MSLENIRKRVMSFHQIADNKNMTGSLSSDDFDMADVGEKVAAVELERKKLKNKLIELQKKQKRNDELLKELSILKEITNEGRACNIDDDASNCNASSRTPQVQQSKDKRKLEVAATRSSENISKIQATLQSLEGMVNIISQDCSVDGSSNIEATESLPRLDAVSNSTNQKLLMIQSTLQNLEGMMNLMSQDNNTDAISNIEITETLPKSVQRQASSAKRDNVQKKHNSGFPARRHYEAEGRANEDADLPVLTPTSLPSLEKWCDSSGVDKKIRKPYVGQKQVKVLNDIMSSIQDAEKTGALLPAEHLRILRTQPEEQYSNAEDSGEDSCDSGVGTNMISHGRMPENISASAKEIGAEGPKGLVLDVSNQKRSESMASDDLETGARRKQKLDKLASQFQQLLQLFPSSERKHDDLVRSSGEGDYAQNRNHPANPTASSEHGRNSQSWDNSIPRQDNLQLTRQNIVSFESQNHNSSSNLHNRDCNSIKKDNINNLSGKMGKLGLQNTILGLNSTPVISSSSISGPSVPVYNLDNMSTFSSEMNQSNCLSNNELESKTAISMLKQPPKKRGFKRNHDSQLLSNSSIDSEPLEGSSSAMAADNTVAATWGGSSTQDYFEDENDERIESLDEDDGTPALGSKSNKSRNEDFVDQYHDMRAYMESVANEQEKKLPKPAISRSQPLMHGNVHNTTLKMTRPISKKRSLSNVTSELYNELPPIPNASDNSFPNATSAVLQQLRNQVDQLNSLCQYILSHDHDTSKGNFCVPPTYSHVPSMHASQRSMPYPCPPPQNIPDISQPHNHQLLLCLSQCYHALYMQQLEIQHLHRCIQHNMDDVFSSSNNQYCQAAEDRPFQPWWSSVPLLPSNLCPTEQGSPLSFPYMQSPLKTYSNPNNPSYPRVSSTQPVRAVIRRSTPENAIAQETLNNQVPPRTRANNFWDNFRSYSRQNLLSASSNVKRNETSGLPVGPQIRQVHPLVPNESFSPTPDISNQFSSAEINRNLPNSEAQDLCRSKRSNSNSFAASSANYNVPGAQRKPLPQPIDSSSTRSVASTSSLPQNVERVPPNSNSSSVNLIQLYPMQHDSKVGFSSIRPTTATESTSAQAQTTDSSAAQNEPSDFLGGLFREAQAIQSEGRRQSALQIIRALAVNDRRDLEAAAENKIQNDHPAVTSKNECAMPSTIPTGEICTQLCNQAADADIDKTTSKAPCEGNVPWNNQNLPTAAISPLNKHSAQRPISTGAVRKKPRQSNTSADPSSNMATNTLHDPPELDNPWDGSDAGISNHYRAPAVYVNKVVDRVISNLQPIFPYGQMKEDPCPGFWAAVNAYILDSLKALFPLSHKKQADLQRSLDHFLSRFVGMRFIECEFEFLKCLSAYLSELVGCYMYTGGFTSIFFTSTFEEDVSVLEADDKMRELCVKMPTDHYDKTRELSIKMPVEENEVFSSQFRTVFSQNVAEGNSNSDIAQPAVKTASPEEDVECDCEPGVELEHEVETGTEADLAEADQSPGQQGNSASGISSTAEAWSMDQNSEFLAKNVGASSSEKHDNVASGELSTVAELGLGLQEVCLDDIPTKLCPRADEEIECEPMRDEQAVSIPVQEGDDAEENMENKCDNELSGTK
ncbi:uncharacterized protein LOC129218670 isoform X2 [Uloborus diversus]|uniref:uncharacterized protein LOC129218670 isoform X2 n=1 Tax=Uloborus diversus TaxID=327109 RepID=UPI00240A6151|nr:uncharacterized protein LOC129218670 isoform X2 [Uloborus diversus]